MGEIVGNTARYARNNRVPARRQDVIESFRWVTHAQCVKAGILKLPRG